MSENGSLPRLGSAEAPKAVPKTEMVELEDRGVSIELRKPRVDTIVEFQEKTPDETDANGNPKEADPRRVHSVTVWLISQMLVDPKWNEEQLAPEVADWTVSDWNHVQRRALDLAGLGEEAQRNAQSEFQGASN